MQRTVLLLGATGQLGTELQRELSRMRPEWEIIAPSRTKLDVSDPQAVNQAVRSASPDFVINAAAYTAVDAAESHSELAFRINADAVGAVADAALQCGAFCVHFSTDYVFDGLSPTPYVESAAAHPLNVYGASKLEGELRVQMSGARYLVIRSGWLYSMHHSNFVLSILNKARAQQELRVVNDQIGTPTSAMLLARETCRALTTISDAASPDECCGIFHVAAHGEVSWFEFAQAILGHAELRSWHPIPRVGVVPISSQQLGAPAKRPAFSVLDTRKFYSAFGGSPVAWQQAFDEVVDGRGAVAAMGPR
jgi:dTDP-4-dehydrorhamnose reductase